MSPRDATRFNRGLDRPFDQINISRLNALTIVCRDRYQILQTSQWLKNTRSEQEMCVKYAHVLAIFAAMTKHYAYLHNKHMTRDKLIVIRHASYLRITIPRVSESESNVATLVDRSRWRFPRFCSACANALLLRFLSFHFSRLLREYSSHFCSL